MMTSEKRIYYVAQSSPALSSFGEILELFVRSKQGIFEK
jgi:hypothetical protein